MILNNKVQTKTGFGVSTISALLLAIIPKCPICLAAYSTFFAAIGVNASILNGIRISLSALLLVSVAWLVLRVVRQRRFLQALGLVAATGLVLSGWIIATPTGFKIGSVAFLTIMALWLVRSRERLTKSHQVGSCKQC